MTPFRTGLALAITVGLFYSMCTLAWVLAPDLFLGFLNSLFHGLDFTNMVRPGPFAWQKFLVALSVLSTWALFAGAVFARLFERLSR